LTVSETSTDPPQDDEKHINSPNNLALEATFINHNLSQQVLRMVIQIITREKNKINYKLNF
jgi:translation initiation factor 3 subunit D